MKTILVDAVYAFIIESEGGFKIFKEMHDMFETFPIDGKSGLKEFTTKEKLEIVPQW